MSWKIKGLPEEEMPKFTEGQRDTLIASLPKWQRLSWMPEGLEEEPLCACCATFATRCGSSFWCCDACPIYQTTKINACVYTPYHSWVYTEDSTAWKESGFEYLSDESKDAAEAELQFLEGLYDIAAMQNNP
jgi:hypothetical protein